MNSNQDTNSALSDKKPFIHPTAVVDAGCTLGSGSKVWHFSHLMSDCIVGRNCTIGQNVFIGSKVRLGDGCKVQNNVSLYTGICCEEDVFLGPSCVFTNVVNPRAFIERKTEFRQTLVKKGASIGANATILCGHTIGEFALVGAGAIVTTDIPPYSLFTGCPARQSGWVSRSGCILEFDSEGIGYCPESGEKYRLEKEGVCLILTDSPV